MTRASTDLAERTLARERELKRELAANDGLADCGRASHGRFVAGCRCDACRAANADYERSRRRRAAYGRSGFVDAEPVREHVRRLQLKGYTYKEIEHLTGCAHSTMHGLMVRHWRTGEPVKRVNRGFAERLMALGTTDTRRWLTKGRRVRCDMGRQVDDLYRAGIPVARQARESGIDKQILYRIRGRTCSVEASTLHAWTLALPRLRRLAYGEHLANVSALEWMGV